MGIVMSFYRVTPDELAAVEEDPGGAEELLDAAYEREKKDGGPEGYLDKAWHGLSFLFSRARIPVDLEDDTVYLDDEGRLGGWEAEDVAAVAHALRATSFDELARHYDPVVMTERDIYPGVIWVRDGDEARKYLEHFFKILVAFFDDAASRGCAVLKTTG